MKGVLFVEGAVRFQDDRLDDEDDGGFFDDDWARLPAGAYGEHPARLNLLLVGSGRVAAQRER